MRLKFSFYIFLIIFISCDSYERYKGIVEKEIQSGVRNDDIFLDFRLRMNEDQFEIHRKKLLKEKKLENYSDYKMKTSDFRNSLSASISPDYFEDKLYRLSIYIEMPEPCRGEANRKSCAGNILNEIVNNLRDTYGNVKHIGDTYSSRSIKPNGKVYYWIDGNRQVNIMFSDNSNNIRIEYEDVVLEKIVTDLERKHRDEKYQEEREEYKNSKRDL